MANLDQGDLLYLSKEDYTKALDYLYDDLIGKKLGLTMEMFEDFSKPLPAAALSMELVDRGGIHTAVPTYTPKFKSWVGREAAVAALLLKFRIADLILGHLTDNALIAKMRIATGVRNHSGLANRLIRHAREHTPMYNIGYSRGCNIQQDSKTFEQFKAHADDLFDKLTSGLHAPSWNQALGFEYITNTFFDTSTGVNIEVLAADHIIFAGNSAPVPLLTCAISGELVTEYSFTNIPNVVVNNANARASDDWVFARTNPRGWGFDNVWTLKTHTIRVISRDDTFDLVGTEDNLPEGVYIHEGLYYNYDIANCVHYLMGTGLVAPDEVEDLHKCKHTDVYLPDESDFEIGEYCSDVTTVLPSFHSMENEATTDNTLYLGVELEVTAQEKGEWDEYEEYYEGGADLKELAYNSIVALNGHCMAMEDGSLDHGFELVSVPCTLAYHKAKVWEDFLARGYPRNELQSYDDSACGIHVHMSRKAFTPLQLAKFVAFVNSPANEEFIAKIAQRKDSSYSRTIGSKKLQHALDFSKENTEKYRHVNVCKSASVEVRIFKGTLHYPAFIKNLEFCHALHAYCSSGSGTGVDMQHLTAKKFMEWVTKYRKTYPYLYEFLIFKDMVAQPKRLRTLLGEHKYIVRGKDTPLEQAIEKTYVDEEALHPTKLKKKLSNYR